MKTNTKQKPNRKTSNRQQKGTTHYRDVDLSKVELGNKIECMNGIIFTVGGITGTGSNARVETFRQVKSTAYNGKTLKLLNFRTNGHAVGMIDVIEWNAKRVLKK